MEFIANFNFLNFFSFSCSFYFLNISDNWRYCCFICMSAKFEANLVMVSTWIWIWVWTELLLFNAKWTMFVLYELRFDEMMMSALYKTNTLHSARIMKQRSLDRHVARTHNPFFETTNTCSYWCVLSKEATNINIYNLWFDPIDGPTRNLRHTRRAH